MLDCGESLSVVFVRYSTDKDLEAVEVGWGSNTTLTDLSGCLLHAL